MGGSIKIRLPKIPWSTDIIIFRFIYIYIHIHSHFMGIAHFQAHPSI